MNIEVIYMGLFDIFKKKPQLTEEQRKWNKMWELWVNGKAKSPYTELMTYESEINNGGHSQYFTNVENVGDLSKEMSALERILPVELQSNLSKAYQAYLKLEESEEDETAEATLDACDSVFYENEQEIHRLLNEYAGKIEL